MSPAPFFFLLIGLTLAVVIIVDVLKARRAGISRRTPVCGACYYALGGWSSSLCPECGRDVRRTRVRVGPRSVRYVLGIVVLIISVVGVGAVASKAYSHVFETRTFRGHARYMIVAAPTFWVTYEVNGRWHRFPRHREYQCSISFTQVGQDASGSWRNGRYSGAGLDGRRVLTFDDSSGAPTPAELRAAIDAAEGGVLSPEQVDALDFAVRDLVGTMVAAQEAGAQSAEFMRAYSSGLIRYSGGGGGGSRSMTIVGILMLFGTIIVSAWLGLWAIGRWCPSGWRAPREGEWSDRPGGSEGPFKKVEAPLNPPPAPRQ